MVKGMTMNLTGQETDMLRLRELNEGIQLERSHLKHWRGQRKEVDKAISRAIAKIDAMTVKIYLLPGPTEISVCEAILNQGKSLKQAAADHNISDWLARKYLHKLCKRANYAMYIQASRSGTFTIPWLRSTGKEWWIYHLRECNKRNNLIKA